MLPPVANSNREPVLHLLQHGIGCQKFTAISDLQQLSSDVEENLTLEICRRISPFTISECISLFQYYGLTYIRGTRDKSYVHL